MTPRTLKIEFWLSVTVVLVSLTLLGFLLLSAARGRFPDALLPFVNRFLDSQEKASIEADLGIKLGAASMVGLLVSMVGFVHYFVSRREMPTRG